MQNEELQQVDPGKKEQGQNDTSHEPIITPEEVPESNDEKIDQDFPGYPHYPAKDDILNPGNGTQRVNVDIENFTPEEVKSDINLNKNVVPESAAVSNASVTEKMNEDDLEIVPGTDADVTEEDLMILETIDKDFEQRVKLDTEDDAVNLKNEELDVPGAELDDVNESLGEEDEENNYYSIGGDNHESLEGR